MKQNKGLLGAGLVVGVASILAAILLVSRLDKLAKISISEAVPAPGRCSFSGKCASGWEERQEGGGIQHCVEGRRCRTVRIECRNLSTNKYCLLTTETRCTNGRVAECNHTPTPTPTATPTGTPTGTPTSTPTGTPTPSPSGTPNACGGTCGSNYNCQGGLFCFIKDGETSGFCRNPDCPGEASCGCHVSTPTPPLVLGASAPPELPKTGSDNWTILAGLVTIGISGVAIFKKFKML